MEELCHTIDGLLGSGRVSPAEADTLAGRLGVASSHLFARPGSAVLWHPRQRATHRSGLAGMPDALGISLRAWQRALRISPPRTIPLGPGGEPLVIFSDGFCDPESGRAGMGAVLLDKQSGTFEAFGCLLPTRVVATLKRSFGCGEQLVAQAEILPVFASRVKWAHLLSARPACRVIQFIDNDAARYGLIKGHSPSAASAWLISEFWTVEASLGCCTWFDRVPSKSNIADGPSRLDFARLPTVAGHSIRVVDAPEVEEQLIAGLSGLGR